tara:strand:- start:3520 stop:3801 length:282 start_codon:yes stop_codon:yes gene_type:complete
MIGKDKDLYCKMVGVWSITALPRLQAEFIGDTVKFTCNGGNIISMDSTLFYSLEPIEIVRVLEEKFYKNFGVDGKVFRKSLDGFKKDPFSSQN